MTVPLQGSPVLLELAFSARGSGPQGLRRPRFSFFRFTFQTSRGLTDPSPASSGAAEARTSDMATGHGRMVHRVNSEGLRRRVIAQATARQDELYSLRLWALSTVRTLK